MKAPEIQINRRPEKTHVRTVAFFASLACLTVWLLLVHSTDILAEVFKGLGVQLSYATKVLISNYTWIYPLLFGGAAASLIANEILVRDTSRRLQTSRALFAADQRFRRSGDYCFVFALAQFD
jgi:hypothetical protein